MSKIFAPSSGISSSLDTVLATTLGSSYNNRLKFKQSNPTLLSEKSISNHSSKSSSGSSLTLTNCNNNSASANSFTNPTNQFPHHQFYTGQISTSANWNSNINIRSNSVCSQKVNSWNFRRAVNSSKFVILAETRAAIDDVKLVNCASKQKNKKSSRRNGFTMCG